jgi:hypothetical protein
VGGGSDFAAAPGQWVESFQPLPAAGPG